MHECGSLVSISINNENNSNNSTGNGLVCCQKPLSTQPNPGGKSHADDFWTNFGWVHA